MGERDDADERRALQEAIEGGTTVSEDLPELDLNRVAVADAEELSELHAAALGEATANEE